MDITKVIIPAAGLGTRFLPFTKAVPKEMIPVLNKPAIQYIIEEAVLSDIHQCIFITSKDKEAISNHFDLHDKLEHVLKERNQEQLIAPLNKLMRSIQCTYVRQSEPLGLGHAVLMAQHLIGPKEYVGVMLPDDLIVDKQPGLEQLIRIARQEKASVIAVQEVPDDCISAYGVVAIKKQITPHLFQINHLVEKPAKKDAPSNLAVVGRYVLSPKIFKALQELNTFHYGELQFTDGISNLMKMGEKVFAYKLQGQRYDVGTPVGWLKANLGFALQHPAYAADIKQFIAEIGTAQSFVYNNAKTINHTTTQ